MKKVIIAVMVPLLFTGCLLKRHQGEIVTFSQSVVGIDISQSPQSPMHHLRIGYIRAAGHIVPTTTNGVPVNTPNFQNSMNVGAGSTAHIREDLAVGAATKNLDDRR